MPKCCGLLLQAVPESRNESAEMTFHLNAKIS